MCWALIQRDGKRDIAESKDLYVPKPFSKLEFEPIGWTNILATLDLCTKEITPALFCNKEGYDLFTFQMVNVIPIKTKEEPKQESTSGEEKGCHLWKVDKHDEISLVDWVSKDEPQEYNYYNASNELLEGQFGKKDDKNLIPIVYKT